MESAVAGECPEFPEPTVLPELEGLDSEHTSSSSYSSPSSEGEYEEEPEEEEERKGRQVEGKGWRSGPARRR